MKMEPKPAGVNAKILRGGKNPACEFILDMYTFVARDHTQFVLDAVHSLC